MPSQIWGHRVRAGWEVDKFSSQECAVRKTLASDPNCSKKGYTRGLLTSAKAAPTGTPLPLAPTRRVDAAKAYRLGIGCIRSEAPGLGHRDFKIQGEIRLGRLAKSKPAARALGSTFPATLRA